MGEFSLTHILLVLGIVLIFFGPSRLPSLGSSMGKAIRGFKDAMKGGEAAEADRAARDSREFPTAALDPREVQPLSREVQERLASVQSSSQSQFQSREKSRSEADHL